MRDLDRIRPFCERLARVWERVPDWRFGQLMSNALGSMSIDPFFPEDDKMIEYLEGYVGLTPGGKESSDGEAQIY